MGKSTGNVSRSRNFTRIILSVYVDKLIFDEHRHIKTYSIHIFDYFAEEYVYVLDAYESSWQCARIPALHHSDTRIVSKPFERVECAAYFSCFYAEKRG